MSLEPAFSTSELEALRVELDRIRRMIEQALVGSMEQSLLGAIALQLLVIDVIVEERGYDILADDVRSLKRLLANLAVASKLNSISRRAGRGRRWRKREPRY